MSKGIIWMPVIGVILALVLGIVVIVSLVAILEVLKIVAIVFIIPFLFLWLWAFFKERFDLDKYISASLALVLTGFAGYWVYRSWWAIVSLAVVTIILWVAYQVVVGRKLESFMDFIDLLVGETPKGRKK